MLQMPPNTEHSFSKVISMLVTVFAILVTNILCFFLHLGRTPTFKRCHQDRISVTNLSHQQNDVTKLVTPTSLSVGEVAQSLEI